MQTIIVDMTPGFRMPTIYYSQGDVGTQFAIDLRSRFGDSFPTGTTVTIQATKPSGFGFSVSADSTTGGLCVFTTTAEMTDEFGRFPAELKVTKTGLTLFTANFYMDGERNAHPEGTTDGQQEQVIPELTQLVERVEDAASSVLDMTVNATTLAAGSQATYSYDEDTNTATFGIPQGEAGAGAAGVVASAYSSSSTYAVGDYVIHNSNLYRCTTAITTAEAFTAAHWTQVVLGDDVSDLKADLSAITSKTIIGKNKFNPNDSDIVENKYINQDGSFTANTAYNTSGYIDVSEISQIVVSCSNSGSVVGALNRAYVFYDASKTIMAGGSTSASNANMFTVAEGAKYVRISYANTAQNYQVESGYVATAYAPFSFTSYANNSTNRTEKPIKYIFGNLQTSDGTVISANNRIVSDGLVVFHAGDRIEIDYSTINMIMCLYNSNGTYKNKYWYAHDEQTSIIEFTETTYAKPRFAYNDNRVIANFTNLFAYFSITQKPMVDIPSFWQGKSCLAFGTSITFGYQLFDSSWTGSIESSTPSAYSYMAEACARLGMSLTNLSAPGGVLAESTSDTSRFPLVNRWDDAVGDFDLIVLDCATNDFQYAWTPFGEFEEIGNTHNPNTFIGALQIVCEGLMAKYPRASFVWLTPLKRYQTGLYGRQKNAIGKTLEDYANAIKDICNYYSIKVIDVNAEAGINPMIAEDQIYFNAEADVEGYFYTHPNMLGHYAISEYVTKQIDSFK